MLIKVSQTKSNFKNVFDIEINGALIYRAGTPWSPKINVRAPAVLKELITSQIADVLKLNAPLALSDINDNLKLSAFNDKNSAVIIDETQTLFGRIKPQIRNSFIIENYGETLNCYDKAAGKTRCISIYLNDFQIAQLSKPLNVVNNRDEYYIFLLDEYKRFSEILAFFAVYLDARYYNRDGEIAISKKNYGLSASISPDDKYYNSSWIRDNFDLAKIAPEYIPYDEANKGFLGLLRSLFKPRNR